MSDPWWLSAILVASIFEEAIQGRIGVIEFAFRTTDGCAPFLVLYDIRGGLGSVRVPSTVI